jgi:hypothetical protein
MTKVILTQEEIGLLDYSQCRAALKALHREYNLDKPLEEFTEDQWPLLNDIANTLLYLEDRVAEYEDLRNNMAIEDKLEDLDVD